MKLHLFTGMGLVVALAGVARAEDQAIGGDPLATGAARLEVKHVDPSMVDAIPRSEIAPANPPSRIIYLNRCANGCTIHPGFESSINQTSSILSQTANLSAWQFGDAQWSQLVQCVRSTYSAFGVQITDQDPGNVDHWEAIIAGTAQEAGMTCDNTNGCILGVAPGTNQCPGPIINDAIVYDFVDTTGWFPDNLNAQCWVASQEIAHAFGLDHEVSSIDPMSYVGLDQGLYPLHSFQNQALPCGANSHDDQGCYCPSTDDPQNSYQMIMNVFGGSTPTPPSVTIDDPANGASVTPGFPVHTTITDDQGVASASLSIDGSVTQTITISPFYFNAPSDIASGSHTVTVTATDTTGSTGSASINVNVIPPCSIPADCANVGADYTCVGGRCVPGDGTPGGLGSTCTMNSDCSSGQCASDTSGNSYCVEQCTVGSTDCPGGFSCVGGGTSGVCWPEQGGLAGGCLDAGGGSPTLPIFFGLGLGALMIRRRRK